VQHPLTKSNYLETTKCPIPEDLSLYEQIGLCVDFIPLSYWNFRTTTVTYTQVNIELWSYCEHKYDKYLPTAKLQLQHYQMYCLTWISKQFTCFRLQCLSTAKKNSSTITCIILTFSSRGIKSKSVGINSFFGGSFRSSHKSQFLQSYGQR